MHGRNHAHVFSQWGEENINFGSRCLQERKNRNVLFNEVKNVVSRLSFSLIELDNGMALRDNDGQANGPLGFRELRRILPGL